MHVFQISFPFFPVSLKNEYVKSKIEGKLEMPVDMLDHLTLWRRGVAVGRLLDGRPLSSYNIQQGDTIKIRMTLDDMVSHQSL